MNEHEKRLDLTAKQIAALTNEAFKKLIERIRNGEAPRDAIGAIIQDFDPAYREVLATAFSATLKASAGASELKAYPIGDVTLSQRLYAEARLTGNVVQGIVQRHTAGWQDARKLAMDIYEGYGFKDGNDPLQWPANSPKWPKYMREAVMADPGLAGSYQRLLARIQASSIKTPALRAAYTEALNELESGKGFDRLHKKLDVAFQERMRYFSNRIAQTELHRAWMDSQANEIMADDSIEVVKFVMSGTHPKTDICDLYAKMDKYGLGPGLYPKSKAPKPPLHPHCRCVLHSKRLLSAAGAKENPAAERAYLRKVWREEGESKAARVVGSRARLNAVMKKTPVEDVVNLYRPVPYRLGMVGGGYNGGMKNARPYLSSVERSDFYRHSIANRNHEEKKPIAQFTNQSALASALGKNTVNVDEIILQASYIGHIHDNHASGGLRKDKNPVTESDLSFIESIVNGDKAPENKGRTTHTGNPLIKFSQTINGIEYKVIGEIREGKKNRNIAVYNFYKR